MDRIRAAALQYYVRPVRTLDEFDEQVRAMVETAVDYQCHLIVFPEYLSVQLLTLGDVRRPMPEQIRDLSRHVPRFLETMTALARRHGVYICGGTFPSQDGPGEAVYNDCFLFSPDGRHGVQGKIHMTRFEDEEWKVSARQRLRVFETAFGKLAITICYDVEFPELARAAARAGAHILLCPSCTDDRQSFMRVRYCAHARAIENQLYVVQAPLVGSLPMVPAVSLNYGQAGILTPSDFAFSRDGILAEGIPNQEMMVVGELNLRTITDSRESGTVLPLRDSRHTADVISTLEEVRL